MIGEREGIARTIERGHPCDNPLVPEAVKPSALSRLRNPSPAALLSAITLLALLLQASRLPMRWNQISFAYAAYFGEYLWVIEDQGFHKALTTFVGIHPPGYSLLFAALAALGSSPLVWHSFSGLLAVAAVPVLAFAARAGMPGDTHLKWIVPAAALLFATSPHRTAYGLEVNNYPLLMLATCLQWLAFARFTRDPGAPRRVTLLALSTAACLWTHGLGVALPAAQLFSLLLLPESRVLLKPFARALGASALLCLPLLPGLFAIASSDGINEALGAGAAWTSLTELLPARYGSKTAAWAVASLAGLGATSALSLPAGRRLVPVSWLLHVTVAGAMIFALIALGIASPTQLPYYLAPLPSLLLLSACALLVVRPPVDNPDQGLLFQLVTPQRAAMGVLLLCAVVNSAALSGDWLQAREVRSAAAKNYPLVASGIGQWSAGSSLALIQFPQYMDDDKDAVDPIYSLLPLNEGVWFDDPGVDGMVPFDPFFGQPVRYSDDRWLYTFTSFSAVHLSALADALKEADKGLIIAAYGCSFSQRESLELGRWARARGATEQRGKDEGVWLWEPQGSAQ